MTGGIDSLLLRIEGFSYSCTRQNALQELVTNDTNQFRVHRTRSSPNPVSWYSLESLFPAPESIAWACHQDSVPDPRWGAEISQSILIRVHNTESGPLPEESEMGRGKWLNTFGRPDPFEMIDDLHSIGHLRKTNGYKGLLIKEIGQSRERWCSLYGACSHRAV